MKTKFVNKKPYVNNKTSVSWTISNPVLAAGELGLDTGTNMLKMGDGVTTWVELPTISMPDDDKLKNKLKNMLFLKYVNMLQEELGRMIKPSDFDGPEPMGWRTWMDENGMTYSQTAHDHVKLDLTGKPIYIPKEFANKALVLGFVP